MGYPPDPLVIEETFFTTDNIFDRFKEPSDKPGKIVQFQILVDRDTRIIALDDHGRLWQRLYYGKNWMKID